MVTKTELDFEVLSQFLITVTAVDSDKGSNSTKIQIKVRTDSMVCLQVRNHRSCLATDRSTCMICSFFSRLVSDIIYYSFAFVK